MYLLKYDKKRVKM